MPIDTTNPDYWKVNLLDNDRLIGTIEGIGEPPAEADAKTKEAWEAVKAERSKTASE